MDNKNPMESGAQELIDMLYSMISEAWTLPLGAERCLIERDKALDLLDEIKAQLPAELNEARRLLAVRSEYVANAKREAEKMREQAENYARNLVDKQEVVRNANKRAADILAAARTEASQVRSGVQRYADDHLRETEESLAATLAAIKQTRAALRTPNQKQE